MLRSLFLAAAVATTAGPVSAQLPAPSPVDGQWYFRGDPFQPAYIETVATPRGLRLILTNEKGTRAEGWLSRNGRQVTVPAWNLVGRVRRDAIIWPNGDFWGR